MCPRCIPAVFPQALRSLARFPLPLRSGRSAAILQHFGPALCARLDQRLRQHRQGGRGLKGRGSEWVWSVMGGDWMGVVCKWCGSEWVWPVMGGDWMGVVWEGCGSEWVWPVVGETGGVVSGVLWVGTRSGCGL